MSENTITLTPGPRTTASDEILRIESELDNLNNPAVPFHLIKGRSTPAEWRELIEEETQHDEPRQHVIGYANRRLRFHESE